MRYPKCLAILVTILMVAQPLKVSAECLSDQAANNAMRTAFSDNGPGNQLFSMIQNVLNNTGTVTKAAFAALHGQVVAILECSGSSPGGPSITPKLVMQAEGISGDAMGSETTEVGEYEGGEPPLVPVTKEAVAGVLKVVRSFLSVKELI